MKSLLNQTTITINLPSKYMKILKETARLFDMTPSQYVRHLVDKDLAKPDNIPVKTLTPEYAAFLEEKMDEYFQGKTRRIDDVDEFMKSVTK